MVKPPLKVEYSSPNLGKTVIPFLDAIANWGVYAVKNYAVTNI